MALNSSLQLWLDSALKLSMMGLAAPSVSPSSFRGKHAEQEYADADAAIKRQHRSLENSAELQKYVGEKVARQFAASLPAIASTENRTDELPIVRVELIDLLPDPKATIEAIIAPFFDIGTEQVFYNFRKTIEENRKHATGADTPRGLVKAYLKGTPFVDNLFFEQIPVYLDNRNEHQWVVAPQGAGKSNLLDFFIERDFGKVEKGVAAVIVMDSQNDIIDMLSHLPFFETSPDKFLMIDAANLIPINLFTMGKNRRNSEALVNHALDLLLYCFNSLMGAELTPKQTTLFNAIVRVCMEIPNATLDTFHDFLIGEHEQHAPYIAAAGKETQRFFDHQYKDPSFKPTMQEIAWRLSSLRQVSVFDRMFSPNPSDFDLYDEINKAQVIFIDTDRELLGERTEIFGRMWIALLLQASQQRASIVKADRLPVHFYIDECQDYISQDGKITQILDQARKMNIGMILAHQRTGQISPPVLDALANCSIRMSRATNDSFVARALQTTPEYVNNQPVGQFASYIRGITPHAISVRIPLKSNRPRMSDIAYEEILTKSRARFKVQPIEPVERQEYEPTPEEDEPPPPPKGKKGRKLDPSF